ncbi:MAG: SCO family protein [Bryobacteraceae bacterium]|nr:SCO family protein [Bryobacteraceae bacterium]
MHKVLQLPNSLTGSFALLVLTAASAVAQLNTLPQELEGIGVDEKLGQRVNLDLEFTGENGYPTTLRSFFKEGKPVVLNMVYYRCPMLCNLVLNAQTSVLKDLAWSAGNEFEIVTISIDPKEGFDLAKSKKKWYLDNYGRPQASAGWHFLTDYQGNSKRIADQVGFNYRLDPKTEQFAHAAAIIVLTPDGRVSRYLYGLKYQARDMRLALTEASEGRLGTVTDRLLLFCFHYDANAKSYVPFARNVMKAGGLLTIFIVGFIMWMMWRKDRQRSAELRVPDGVVITR